MNQQAVATPETGPVTLDNGRVIPVTTTPANISLEAFSNLTKDERYAYYSNYGKPTGLDAYRKKHGNPRS